MTEPTHAHSPRVALARVAALLAVLLAVAASLSERITGRGVEPAEPAASRVLPDLHDMTAPPGTVVEVIVAPTPAGDSAVKALLHELAWRRPDLRFATTDTWPDTVSVEHVLTLGDVSPTPRSRRVWQSGIAAYWTVERE
ncbi:MAG: hypothetical protein AB1625_05705 [Acidobacteriota bacterium]